MGKNFTVPPSPEKPANRYTDMELKAIEAHQQGKAMKAVTERNESGGEVVKLEEIQEVAGVQGEIVRPFGNPQAPDGEKPAGRPVSVSKEELDKLAEAAFGPEPERPSPEEERPLFTNYRYCPCCNWDLTQEKKYKPDDEDKKELIRSILGERRFYRKVEFLGGKLAITYRSLFVNEEDRIYQELKEEFRDTTRPFGELEWMQLFRRYQMVLMLHEIDYAGKVETFPEIAEGPAGPDGPIVKATRSMMKRWNVTINSLLLKGALIVNELYHELLARAEDPDFLEGLSETEL